MSSFVLSRRTFLLGMSAAAVASLLPKRSVAAAMVPSPHPNPRPGITGAKVATHEQLAAKPKLIEVFDAVREQPEIIDGIRCNCGCSHTDGFYSLLSCYEGEKAMAMECSICQGQGRLATRLQKAGKTLDEIRVAIDAKYS